MNPPSVCIVIVNWNGRTDTLACLQSLEKDTHPRKTVVVVDNGSKDDSVVAIRRAFPSVEIIETGRNLGFTGGNNAGIAYALQQGHDFVYLLNNDTISDPRAISLLLAEAEARQEFGLLVPLIVYHEAPHEAWFAGSTMDLSRGTALHDNVSHQKFDDSVLEIAWATGCAMLMRASVARTLNGFDDRFFLNWEDVDLSIRARKAGFKLGLVRSACVEHKVSRSLNSVPLQGLYYSVRNNLLLVRKHSGSERFKATLSVIQRKTRASLCAVFRRDHNAWSQVLMTWRAILDHCRGQYGPYVPR